jgi:hypothetical protein
MNRFVTCFSAAAALTFAVSPLAAQTDTTFTYQGSLNENGGAASGAFDLQFLLFDALSGGNQAGSTIVMNDVPVTDGLLTTELDFGTAAFNNESRWLEIMVEGVTLSPRQPITRSPYSIQTRGIFVDENNNVGIGTSTPSNPLHVESSASTVINAHATADEGAGSAVYARNDSTSGRGVYGWATADSGTTDGVRGDNRSTSGRGVYGFASAESGNTEGVRGVVRSTSGRGVFGRASASSGTTYGVYGDSFSSAGAGVYGEASASTGFAYGGYFQSASTNGRGVFGEATATTGNTYGVYGQIESTSGSGVYGEASADTGLTYGVHGKSNGQAGNGVFGEASHASGPTYGVFGTSVSTGGRGVFGLAAASTGGTYGVYGQSTSTSGRGVFGHATAGSGLTDGVFGLSDSTSGRGVDAWASASSGTTYGVYGTSSSPIGVGVLGDANSTSGVNYGVVGRSRSSSGFDFLADGAGSNYGSTSSRRWKSNIEPISDPLTKLAQLRGVYYDWDEEHGGHHDLGMIAEEVGEVLPEIVQYEGNGVDAIGMDYSKMTPLLVEAVNALRSEAVNRQAWTSDRIASAERENALLRAENESLSTRLARLEQVVAAFVELNEKENR